MFTKLRKISRMVKLASLYSKMKKRGTEQRGLTINQN